MTNFLTIVAIIIAGIVFDRLLTIILLRAKKARYQNQYKARLRQN